MDEGADRGNARSFLDGFLQCEIKLNLSNGAGSLGNKLSQKIRKWDDAGDLPGYYALGAAVADIAEAVFAVYCIYEAFQGNWEYLAYNVGVKVVPRTALGVVSNIL